MSVVSKNLPEAIDRGHLQHLDGLRAVLAIYVVAGHCYPTIWSQANGHLPDVREALFVGWLGHAYLSVEWFIVLSGYCLMLPVTRNAGRLRGFVSTFYFRRARRILPTFYAALGLTLLLIWGPLGKMTGTHWDVCLPVTPQAIFANVFMVQDLFEQFKINHVFWSIAIEWRLYFLFPIIVWALRRFGPWASTVLIVTAAIAVALQLPRDGAWWGVRETVTLFSLFVLGGLAGSRARWDRRPARIVAATATAIAIWQQSGWDIPMMLRWAPVQELGVGIAAASWLAVWSSAGPSATRRLLECRPLPAIGVMAYSLYLTHAPIVQLCWQWIVAPMGLTGLPALVVLLAMAVPISIVVAYLFYRMAERPFLSRRQHVVAAEELGSTLSGEASLPA